MMGREAYIDNEGNLNPPVGSLPSGLIALWAGLLSAIPDGWALCDGGGGRPDLRDKFIKGAAPGQNPGGTGGSQNHTHTDHPAQTHSGAGVSDHAAKNTDVASVGETKIGTTASTATLKVHTHPISAYAHTVTQPASHPAQAHGSANNEPVYFTLAFIIKV